MSAPGSVPGRDHGEAPGLRAVAGAESHHLAHDAPVAAGLADEDEVVPDDRGSGDEFADGRIHDLAIPERDTGLGVQCQQMAVLRAADHPPTGDGGALAVVGHLRPGRHVLMIPDLLAGRGVERVRAMRRR